MRSSAAHDLVARRRRAHDPRRVHQRAQCLQARSRRAGGCGSINAFVQDRFALTPSAVADRRGQGSSGRRFSGVQVLPNLRARLAARRPRTLCGRRCRGRCARRRGSTASSRPAACSRRRPTSSRRSWSPSRPAIAASRRSTTSLSVNGFYNLYDDMRTTEFVGGASSGCMNGVEGRTYGIEAWGNAQLHALVARVARRLDPVEGLPPQAGPHRSRAAQFARRRSRRADHRPARTAT